MGLSGVSAIWFTPYAQRSIFSLSLPTDIGDVSPCDSSSGLWAAKHGLAQRAHWPWCPAATHIVDAPDACLVLKRQSDGLTLPVFAEVLERLEEFFFHSS